MAAIIFLALSPLISETKTFVYKTVGNVEVEIDVFIPTEECYKGGPVPVMVFLHGGAWIGWDRTEHCRPLFHEFLAAGFVVTSADYRLLPESSFLAGQLEDVKGLETWLRKTLPLELESYKLDLDGKKIVVVGSSAGALLALLTPSLWAKSSSAIMAIYGPTNLHNLPYTPKGPFAQLELPECTPDMLIGATSYASPPTGTPPPKSKEDFLNPRRIMGITMFRRAVTVEFLLRGLINLGEKGEPPILSLPEQGIVGKDEIDRISPLQLCKVYKYPPTYLVLGTEDELFNISHLDDFAKALEATGVQYKAVPVHGKGHAFDIFEAIGGNVHQEVFKPALAWITKEISSQKT